MINIADIAAPVAADFVRFTDLLKSSISSPYTMLGSYSQHIVEVRGKMMRPLLGLLCARLHSDTLSDRVIVSALIFELLHHATLIHDDVIDEAYSRRGEMTVGALLRSRTGVLVGDFLFAKGLRQAASQGAFAEIEVATAAIEAVVEGELRQNENTRTLAVDSAEYFAVIDLKTGALLEGVAKACAISVGASAEQIAAMARFGALIGRAFQIRDDILDYTGSAKTMGKAPYNDIKERKITLPLICAMQNSGGKKDVLAKMRQSDVKFVVDFVVNNGGVDGAEKVMQATYNEAVAILGSYPDSEVKKSLELFAAYAISRTK